MPQALAVERASAETVEVRGPDGPSGLRDVSVVTVLHNSGDVIDGCLTSIPLGVEVIVVDNASDDDGAKRAQAIRPDAVVIRSERNLGFGGGCNLGWRAASRPSLAFVNPDVRLRSGTLEVLLGRLAQERASMVGPVLLDEAGTPRPGKRRPSALLDLCGLLPAAGRWAPPGTDGKLDPGDPVHSLGGAVASVEGAFFAIRRSDLEAIGGFDEDLFLYYEEESLALRLERLGGGAVYEPRAVAEHAGETSTGKVRSTATHHFHRSRVVFYRKRDGDLRGRLVGLLLAFGLIVSAPAAVLNRVLRRARPTTLSYLRDALGGLLAGLTARLHPDVRSD
jgi:N-acetylglucosaminyl-diphospho-decaprenol L-rhamnosyltransferase